MKRKYLKRLEGLLPESQDQNLALTVLYVPYSFVPNDTVLDTNHQGEEALPTLFFFFITLEPRVE